jgi:hypothetical protein
MCCQPVGVNVGSCHFVGHFPFGRVVSHGGRGEGNDQENNNN